MRISDWSSDVCSSDLTPEGAAAAAESALAEQAALLLGPLFSPSAEAVKPIVDTAEVPMITFSNNTAIAGPLTFVMGVTPRTQVDRVVDYAVAQGLRRIAVLAPENAYGNIVVQSLQEASSEEHTSEIRSLMR